MLKRANVIFDSLERKMDFFNILLCLLFIYTVFRGFLLFSGCNPKYSGKLPPGPTPFPIIGNLLQLGNKPHKSLAKLANIHGPIMTVKLGRVTTVVVSSANMAREVLQKHDISFCNRSIPDSVRAHKHDVFSMVWMPVSSQWRNLRKISTSHIFTIQKLDANKDLRRRKVEDLLADIQESCRTGSAVDIGRAAFETTLNLISNTFFSIDFADSSSEIARECREIVVGMMECVGIPNLSDYFPVLRRLDPQGIRQRQMHYFGKMFKIFDGMIDQRLESRNEQKLIITNDALENLLSISISQQNSDQLDRTYLNHFLLDIFVAGTDTSSNTLEWAMAELLHKPETLRQAQLELDQTIGKGNPMEESDIAKLPYLRAIIKETFRLHPIAPLLLPRRAETDVEISGFTIPKGTQVLVNAWAIGRDAGTWENPNDFIPERFLGTEMDVKGQDFELIPFGGGRRICPGLPLAMRMIPFMLGSLIHSFDWKLEDGVTPDSMNMDDKFRITLQMAHALKAMPTSV